MERIRDRRAAHGGLDGRRQLRAGGRHRLTVGQGHRCRTRRRRFSRRHVLIVVVVFAFVRIVRIHGRPGPPSRSSEALQCRIGFAALWRPGSANPPGAPQPPIEPGPGIDPRPTLGMPGSADGIVGAAALPVGLCPDDPRSTGQDRRPAANPVTDPIRRRRGRPTVDRCRARVRQPVPADALSPATLWSALRGVVQRCPCGHQR